jgi:hypothetical protein
MREFSSTRFRLAQAPYWQKILYSSVLGFMLIGVGTNVALGLSRTGLTFRDVVDHYRGNPERMMFGTTVQELLDVTHMHAFMVPLVLLVLGHLFFLCEWPARWKRFVMTVAGLAVLLELLMPWAIVLWDPRWAIGKLVATYGLLGSFGCMIGVPVYEMWSKRPA